MIEVEHLSKFYGSTAAIADISFAVEAGEILGFLGPNGAGKTTTMRILAGFLPATQGRAKIAGFEVHEQLMAVRQRIGYLPENPPLYPEMTVEGFLNFVAQIKGVSAGDRPTRIQTALAKTGLAEKHNTIIRKLSKGFRQRVGIAQAIVHDPPVIILDEPTVGLDPRQIIEVRHLIKQLAKDHTVILSTHILPEVSMTCDRITIINRGRVVVTNTPEQLMAQLSGHSGYELDVQGSWRSVQQCLMQIPGVQSVEGLENHDRSAPPESSESDRHRVRVVSGAELGSELSTAIVQAGLGLYEMRRVQANLEDVFLQLTTEEPSITTVFSGSDTSELDINTSDINTSDTGELDTNESESPARSMDP